MSAIDNTTNTTVIASNVSTTDASNTISDGSVNTNLIIQPDLNNLTLNATGITLHNDSFTFKSNFITAGNGNDTVNGVMDDLDLSATHNGVITNNTFNFGSLSQDDTITLGNGNDTIFGTLNDISISETSGGSIDSNSIMVGSNTIKAGTGTDTVFGTLHDITLSIDDRTNNTSEVMSGVNIDLAGNNITLGAGNNTIYGSMNDLTFNVRNTSVDSEGAATLNDGETDAFGITTYATTYDVGMTNVSVIMGGNTIVAGGGNNTIYGSMLDLTLSDTGGNALTSFADASTGSQVTVETLINDLTIDLTGGGKGNTITAGAGTNTVFGDMRNFTMTAGDAYANSDPNDPTYAFPASPNIQANTAVLGSNFTVGDNHIELGLTGSGTNTVYGDMESLNIVAVGGTAIGYNSNATSGVGDLVSFTYNNDAMPPYFGSPPFLATPSFNNFNFNSDMITVGNGNNVIYGHLETIDLSEGPSQVSSPGSFYNDSPNPGPGYDPSSFPTTVFPTGTVSVALGGTGIDYTNITMEGNVITAGVGTNTIYGDVQSIQNGITEGVDTGTYRQVSSNVYTPYNPNSEFLSLYPVYGNDYSVLSGDVFTMAGNSITAGFSLSNGHPGTGINTIYGTMQDLDFTNVAGTNNQGGGDDSAEFEDMFVLGGTGTFDTTDPGPYNGFFPNFVSTLTGNTITVGNGINTIYGDMRDFITINIGGTEDGYNNPPHSVSSASEAAPYITVNADRCEFFMGDNYIRAGNGINTVFGGMRDLIDANQGGIVENVPTGGTDNGGSNYDNIISIEGNTIDVGSVTNLIYGSMRDLTFTYMGGTGINNAIDSFATALAGFPQPSLIYIGDNDITAQSGNNTIDGAFRNLDWSAEGGQNSSVPGGGYFLPGAGALIFLNEVSMGLTNAAGEVTTGNNITVGDANVSSVNIVSGDGENLIFTADGGSATGGFTAWNGINLNTIAMGANQITINSGGTSVIYGDVQTITWTAGGGIATGSGSYAEGQIYGNVVTMGGNNIIDHGNGADIIYGDAQSISLSVQGGTLINAGSLTYTDPWTGLPVTISSDAAAYMTDNTFTLAGNTIQGGSGNDVIFASLENLSFSAQSSNGAGAGAYFSGTIYYPDGGSNTDTTSSPVVDTGNIFTFGNDVINAGSGNDIIIGSDVLNLSGLSDFFEANPLNGNGPNLNEIDWSNNTVTGGAGADHFVWALEDIPADALPAGLATGAMEMQGADLITDFNPGIGDSLVFGNVIGANGNLAHDAALLDSVSTFVDFKVNGQQEIAVIFHGANADNNLGSVYQGAINALVAADQLNHLSTTTILQDVAQFIYGSSTASATVAAGGGIASGLAAVVAGTAGLSHAAADGPLGALILENQSGYNSFVSLEQHFQNALSIHPNTVSIVV